MPLTRFDLLPDAARLWCFGASRAPGPAATARLLDDVSAFLEEWTAHGAPLEAALDWRHHRFLLVGVDERGAGASGCSIDALVGRLRGLEAELGLSLLDTRPVWYRDAGGVVRCVGREAFRRLAAEGEVGPDTPVFDLSVTRVADLRAGRWEAPASRSWHARLLPERLAGGAG